MSCLSHNSDREKSCAGAEPRPWRITSGESVRCPLGFEIKKLHRPKTKREIVSTICSLYDPLRFAAPVTLASRSLIQDLRKAKVDWNQPLYDHFLNRWRLWYAQLPSRSELPVSRHYFLPETEFSKCQMQLHISDASEIGYGASSYLRVRYPDGTIHCSFVMGRSEMLRSNLQAYQDSSYKQPFCRPASIRRG